MRFTTPLWAAAAFLGAPIFIPAAIAAPLWISGGDMGLLFNHVSIYDDVTPIADATVTLNGTDLPLLYPGRYSGTLPVALSPGDPMVLLVVTSTDTVTATDVAPESPQVTSPLEGAVYAPSETITVAWTSTTDPDEFLIQGSTTARTSPLVREAFTVSGTIRSLDVDAGLFPAGDVQFTVFAYENGVFEGDVDPESAMHIRGTGSAEPTVTIEPSSAAKERSWGSVKAMHR